MKEDLPTNLREHIVFSVSNCFIMVVGMVTYNLILVNAFSFRLLIKNFPAIFVCAYILNFFCILKITKLIMSKCKNQFLFPIINVAGMTTAMSFIGLITRVGFTEDFISVYALAILKNYFVALFLLLFVAFPVSKVALKFTKKLSSK